MFNQIIWLWYLLNQHLDILVAKILLKIYLATLYHLKLTKMLNLSIMLRLLHQAIIIISRLKMPKILRINWIACSNKMDQLQIKAMRQICWLIIKDQILFSKKGNLNSLAILTVNKLVKIKNLPWLLIDQAWWRSLRLICNLLKIVVREILKMRLFHLLGNHNLNNSHHLNLWYLLKTSKMDLH